MRKLCPLALAIVVAMLPALPMFGQSEITRPPSVLDHLTKEEGAKIQLNLEMAALLQNRKKADYISATLTDATGQSFNLEVRTRGKFRRRRCEIPPIKLKFLKTGLEQAQLDTMNEIKLVLPCANKEADETLIVREYLVYRMFEKLSPNYCVRARLVQLQLKDKAKKRPQKMLAMLVEHEEEVSGRMFGTVVQEWGIKPDRLDGDQAALAILFQFLAGNTDWDLTSCRNIMLIQPPDSGALKVIPYDFDFSGLVAAPYASPNSECNIRSVLDRCLMDYGVSPEAFQGARKKIFEAKAALYNECINPFLPADAAKDMSRYLDIFFEALSADTTEIPSRLEFPRQ
ncbi:MAG: hypothetical protein ACKVU2_06250 [Saprospiraceae bacterium]